jgi:hypothetical protein
MFFHFVFLLELGTIKSIFPPTDGDVNKGWRTPRNVWYNSDRILV